MPSVALSNFSKMEGIVTCDNTEGSNPQSVETNVANEESNDESSTRTESTPVHAETRVNVNENMGRPRRNSAQAARHKIQAVYRSRSATRKAICRRPTCSCRSVDHRFPL